MVIGNWELVEWRKSLFVEDCHREVRNHSIRHGILR